ncbi:precorrin-6y C5,15-methyltransferase (decarboxylating) subunit CbiE [Nocardioides sp. Kera G14]|uniref:precorrin-6y C5,15-methyltransferase (decarboxylating) subunit CbiE n=1 Tax=Nocardioides sp. Kera G14 TaxID=2884264 RepID=UPI001D12B347|nr:precorrin-6y C5,15-methyltransferase (decarboxylating) subunit CbiE [Nocardioides sp. Kera G14]UDY25025.1 precorrin-6y C5,15-methyltransferase (decarboxylating) subunit CbiE [Nocardioides sp. Kera G14]
MAPVVVVGISADDALADPRILEGPESVVVGAPRHLELLPDVPGQRRLPLPSPLREGLVDLVTEYADRTLIVLASGDPLVSGIGSTLIELLGRDRVVVVPAVSSVALARAAVGWAAESHAVVSVVGRDVSLVRRELAPGRRILVLSSDEHTPRALADLLGEAGYDDSEFVVLGDLGNPTKGSSHYFDKAAIVSAKDFDFARLNIVAITCAGPPLGGWVAGLPDDLFENDGQLTKRDLRASALARLAPVPGERLWDVGAGAGSVGIEWMRAHPTCLAIAIEANTERAERIARNARSLGVPGLEIVHAPAPEALKDLPTPDAIFVGGGATVPGVIEYCLDVLPRGGRIVVHGVTLETEHLLADVYRQHGGELTRLSVETAAPIGSFTGWTPARTVTQWAYWR